MEPLFREIVIADTDRAITFANALIKASKWFEVTPLPFDEWNFVVKNEAGIPKEVIDGT